MKQTIVFTREQGLESALKEELLQANFEVAHIPLIKCVANPLPTKVIAGIMAADWVFFTSAVAVECFQPWLLNSHHIATIGPQTTAALTAGRWVADFEASSHYAVDFVKEWLSLGLEKQKILLPQSSLSHPIISQTLEKHGHDVLAWAMYDTITDRQGQKAIAQYTDASRVIWTFASPSAWKSFYETRPKLIGQHKIAVIGRTTAQAVQADGYTVDYMPDRPSMQALVATVIEKKGE